MNLILILFTFMYSSWNHEVTPSEIRWQQNHQLAFEDFKGPVPNGSPWAATTNSSIYFSYETKNSLLTTVAVYASFSPEKSWMKNKLPEVLAHEQLHFDITEIYARKFYQQAAVLLNHENGKDELNKMFEDANNDCEVLQEQYDSETDHGTKTEEQKQWKKKVTELLASLPPYPTAN